jgi:hypothetical protein
MPKIEKNSEIPYENSALSAWHQKFLSFLDIKQQWKK